MAKALEDLEIVIPKGSDGEFVKKIVMNEEKSEYKEGEIVGKCEIYLKDEMVGEVKIYSDRDIEKGGIFDSIKYNIKSIFK